MALQAKSFSSIITAEPLTLHRGPTEEDKQRRGVKQRRERGKKERWISRARGFHGARGDCGYSAVLFICLQQRDTRACEARGGLVSDARHRL